MNSLLGQLEEISCAKNYLTILHQGINTQSHKMLRSVLLFCFS